MRSDRGIKLEEGKKKQGMAVNTPEFTDSFYNGTHEPRKEPHYVVLVRPR